MIKITDTEILKKLSPKGLELKEVTFSLIRCDDLVTGGYTFIWVITLNDQYSSNINLTQFPHLCGCCIISNLRYKESIGQAFYNVLMWFIKYTERAYKKLVFSENELKDVFNGFLPKLTLDLSKYNKQQLEELINGIHSWNMNNLYTTYLFAQIEDYYMDDVLKANTESIIKFKNKKSDNEITIYNLANESIKEFA